MKKQISFEEVLQYVKKPPYSKFREVIDEYSKKTGQDFSSEINALTVSSLEKHLEQLDINFACPECGKTEGILKYGKRNHIQVYKCPSCGHKFSRFSGTILEKSRWHWDIWIHVLQMTISGESIDKLIIPKQYETIFVGLKTLKKC
ncbi:MAG: IS1 family transposase [Clostridia bacterium]|nr:IS1 family transposase [Clostridia bacterium]